MLKKLSILLSTLLALQCHPADEIAILPHFDLLLVDSVTRINTKSIEPGKLSVLMYFSSDCDFCQKETSELIENSQLINNINFYLLSSDPLDKIKSYSQHYKLHNHTNFVVAQDYTNFFTSHFRPKLTPCLAVYDKSNRLRCIYNGHMPIDTLVSLKRRFG